MPPCETLHVLLPPIAPPSGQKKSPTPPNEPLSSRRRKLHQRRSPRGLPVPTRLEVKMEHRESSQQSSSVQISSCTHQANQTNEDSSCVHHAGSSTFAAVFDGHGGNIVSQFAKEHCYNLYSQHAKQHNAAGALCRSLRDLDNEWQAQLKRHIHAQSAEARTHVRTGSCAVAVVVDQEKQQMTVGNLGDSRCVLARRSRSGILEAVELSTDHSASTDKERQRLRMEHGDAGVVSEFWDEATSEYAWLVQGTTRFTRSIGDSFMKDVECAEYFNSNCKAENRLPLPHKPFLSSQPEVQTSALTKDHEFVIIASDGLWDEMSSDLAVHAVRQLIDAHGPTADISQLLLEFTLERIVERMRKENPMIGNFTTNDLKMLPAGVRRGVHDDITITVLVLYTPQCRTPSPPTIGKRTPSPRTLACLDAAPGPWSGA